MDLIMSSPTDATVSCHLLDVQWQPRPGIIVNQAKTYGWGFGSEYVYCYSFPTHLEIAQLKGEERFRVKVGSAKGDPIQRIFAQFANNKTAISDSLVVLLIFRTIYATHLERWLHARLPRKRLCGVGMVPYQSRRIDCPVRGVCQNGVNAK